MLCSFSSTVIYVANANTLLYAAAALKSVKECELCKEKETVKEHVSNMNKKKVKSRSSAHVTTCKCL